MLESNKDTVAKRQLPTTVLSPEQSPVVKKVLKSSETEAANRPSRSGPARKALFVGENVENIGDGKHVDCAESAGTLPQKRNTAALDLLLSALNIDHHVEKATTQLKTVVLLPNGVVKTYESFDDTTKSLIMNLCQKK